MGTRNLTLAILNGKYKMAQYGQWDGYPSGVGINILDFLRTMPTDFSNKLKKCKFITDKKIDQYYVLCGKKPNMQWINDDISNKFKERFPQLHRDNAGDRVLKMIGKTQNGLELINSDSFAKDSLYCEYCYVLNFDTKLLLVHTNLNDPALAVFDFDNLPNDEYFISVVHFAMLNLMALS